MKSKMTDDENPYTPYIPPQTDEKNTPIPSYQAETDEILCEENEFYRLV